MLCVSCGNHQTVRAKITERKLLPGNRLQLKYTFEQNGKELQDSLVTENKILEGDTITVKRDRENPHKSTVFFGNE